ncbi:MAG: hypothetical protein DI536_22790 [Archangium gephyra]|uniref:Lipoprotein n=1 Tax=Archangium gephyra TaxID=48 RepID=A0A2W5SZX7_9BACT|nr:MAG: hypothetical protein DI536_22790 [Archangium gephyra]
MVLSGCATVEKPSSWRGAHGRDALVVTASLDYVDSTILTLAPSSDGEWTADRNKVFFDWAKDDELEVELVRDGLSLGRKTTSLGESKLVFAGWVIHVDARRTSMP